MSKVAEAPCALPVWTALVEMPSQKEKQRPFAIMLRSWPHQMMD